MDETAPVRFAPDYGFPPYAFVPGRQPHPIRDPHGHSFGHGEPSAPVPDPAHPNASPLFCQGLDLFNHGYYWEAHELWEHLWHACERRGPLADFLKGLIKLAAAGVKAREGNREGVRRHAARARALFESLLSSADAATHTLGLDITHLAHTAARLADHPLIDPDPCPTGKPVLHITLHPSGVPPSRSTS